MEAGEAELNRKDSASRMGVYGCVVEVAPDPLDDDRVKGVVGTGDVGPNKLDRGGLCGVLGY